MSSISFSSATRDKIVLLLVFAQYVALGYIGNAKSIIEFFLIALVWSDLLLRARIANKLLLTLFVALFVLLLGIFLITNPISEMSLIITKNLLVFVGVWSYFSESHKPNISNVENVAVSIILSCVLIGFIFPNLATDFSSISWKQSYYVDIFSPASVGLNPHFTTQLILSYFLLHLIALNRHSDVSVLKLFSISSPHLLTIIYLLCFFVLLFATGTSTGCISFLVAALVFSLNNKLSFLKFELFHNKFLLLFFASLFLFLFLPILVSSEQLLDVVVYLLESFRLSGHISFLLIKEQLLSLATLIRDAPILPSFQSLLIQADPTGFLAHNEVGMVFLLYSYGSILTILLLILLLFNFTPVGLMFLFSLIHYSFFMTGVGALVIARSQNLLMATRASNKLM